MTDFENTYPVTTKKEKNLSVFRTVIKYILLFAAIICPIVNIIFKGPAWSITVLACLYVIDRFLISPDMVEVNGSTQFLRIGFYVELILIVIGTTLSHGWLDFVLPLVCLADLVTGAAIFCVNIRRYRESAMPFIYHILISICVSLMPYTGLTKMKWPTVALGCTAGLFLLIYVFTCAKAIGSELSRRFHTK